MDGQMSIFKTIRQTAAMGVLSERALRMMVARGKCPGIYVGNKFLINVPLLMEALNEESGRMITIDKTRTKDKASKQDISKNKRLKEKEKLSWSDKERDAALYIWAMFGEGCEIDRSDDGMINLITSRGAIRIDDRSFPSLPKGERVKIDEIHKL